MAGKRNGKGAGRIPILLDRPDKIKVLIETLELGHFAVTACHAAGISDGSYRAWRATGRDDRDAGVESIHSTFLAATDAAEAVGEMAQYKGAALSLTGWDEPVTETIEVRNGDGKLVSSTTKNRVLHRKAPSVALELLSRRQKGRWSPKSEIEHGADETIKRIIIGDGKRPDPSSVTGSDSGEAAAG